MLYAVVLCPKCGRARLAKYPFKSVRCFYCGGALTEKDVVVGGLPHAEAISRLAYVRLKKRAATNP